MIMLISSFSLLPILCLAMDGLLRLDSFIVHSLCPLLANIALPSLYKTIFARQHCRGNL